MDAAEVIKTSPRRPQENGEEVYDVVKAILATLGEATPEDIYAATALYFLHLGKNPPNKREVYNALE